MSKEKLLTLLIQLNNIKDTQERCGCLQKYIVDHIDESLSRLVTMCGCLYNIQDSKVFDQKKKEWREYIEKTWVGNYFAHEPTKYFYGTIIPEAIAIGEENKGPIVVPAKIEQKQNDYKPGFLRRLNLNSTYSRLSILLSCSALVLWCKWLFADKGAC